VGLTLVIPHIIFSSTQTLRPARWAVGQNILIIDHEQQWDYSCSRLLTHCNWFIWPNFPDHSFSSQNKDMFLKTLTHFTCFHTRSNLFSANLPKLIRSHVLMLELIILCVCVIWMRAWLNLCVEFCRKQIGAWKQVKRVKVLRNMSLFWELNEWSGKLGQMNQLQCVSNREQL